MLILDAIIQGFWILFIYIYKAQCVYVRVYIYTISS